MGSSFHVHIVLIESSGSFWIESAHNLWIDLFVNIASKKSPKIIPLSVANTDWWFMEEKRRPLWREVHREQGRCREPKYHTEISSMLSKKPRSRGQHKPAKGKHTKVSEVKKWYWVKHNLCKLTIFLIAIRTCIFDRVLPWSPTQTDTPDIDP